MHRLSIDQAKHAHTIVCEKRDAAFNSSDGPRNASAGPSTPAMLTMRADASGVPPRPLATRRESRATAIARIPPITGPANQIAPTRENGAMNNGQPGVYCENARPWWRNTQ